jgi:hypothetical protein
VAVAVVGQAEVPVSEPSIVTLTIPICTLCLGGAGGECHVPGCCFWMCPAITPEQASHLRDRAFIDIVVANRDAFGESA